MQGISADGILRLNERKSTVIREIRTPRSFAVFFNQTASVALAFDEVREALNRGTDRQAIIRSCSGERHGSDGTISALYGQLCRRSRLADF